MAQSSNRSPSPISNRQNPSSRFTEQNPIARRSLNGSPFTRPHILSNPKSFNPKTPANSPSDFTRNSGEFCSREDKENDKVHSLKQPTKVRSPAILKKGSKNFMAPTISAASKFTPSPRKKILGEKNDSVRTSMSDSFEKVAERFETNSEMGSDENEFEASHDDSDILNLYQKEEGFESLEKETSSDFNLKSDCLCDDYSLKKIDISSSAASPIIDADPSLPPYDPKTNYLSPRPQFLHFKPNPRIRSYLGKENGEIRMLEDIFELENLSSDTEDTESDDSQKGSCEEDSSPEVKTKGAKHQKEEEVEEDSSPPQVKIKGVELQQEEVELETKGEEHQEEEEEVELEEEPVNNLQVSEPRGVEKSRFFSRLRFISLLMILVVGFLTFSATDSPIFNNGSSVLKDSRISKLYDPSELKDVFEEFVMNFNDWSSKHISSYVSKLIPIINGIDKPPATIQFYNLSSFQEYALINRGGFVDPIKMDLGEMYDQYFEDEDETEELQEDEIGDSEIEEEEEEEEAEDEIIESDIITEEESLVQAEFDQNEEQSVNDATLLLIQEVDASPSASVVGDDDVLIQEVDSSSSSVVSDDVETSEESSSSSTHNLLTEANSSLDHILATISVLIAILVPAFLYVNHHQKRKEAVVNDDPAAPCSSEASSFETSAGNKKKRVVMKNNDSLRRDSMASYTTEYSMESPSYGSFTTYEKMVTKKNNGGYDEEMVVTTPVRRSSRIRSKVSVTSE